MKIAYLLYWFPKLSETFIYDEIKWIRQEGHEVFVIASREVTEIPRVHFDGYKRIEDLHDLSLIDLLRKLGVEHVHSHFGRFFYQQGALDLVKVLGVPFTLTVHMSEIWGMKALSVEQWRSVLSHM